MFGHFPPRKSLEKFFDLVVWKKKIIFQIRSFDMQFHNILIKMDNNFTFIMLTIIVPVFDLGMWFGKVKSGNIYSKLRRNPVYLQDCYCPIYGSHRGQSNVTVITWHSQKEHKSDCNEIELINKSRRCENLLNLEDEINRNFAFVWVKSQIELNHFFMLHPSVFPTTSCMRSLRIWRNKVRVIEALDQLFCGPKPESVRTSHSLFAPV